MRRGVRALFVVLLMGAAATSPAAAQHEAHGGDDGPPAASVTIGFAAFSPPHVDVLVGDTVRWENASVRDHTVTASDAAFDSGRLMPGDRYERTFTAPGEVPYFCRLHPIPGNVSVRRVLLEDPGPAGAPGVTRVLRGRSRAAEGTPVVLEADDGSGYATVTTLAPADDGVLMTAVAPTRTTTYRLRADGETSPAHTVVVLDRRLAVRTTRLRGRRTRIEARVTPVSPGTPAVLQVYLAHRFGWWPVARARVDAGSRVRFTRRTARPTRARVVLTLPDGATPVARSRTFLLGSRANGR